MIYSRSTIIAAMSMVMVSLSASDHGKPLQTSIPKYGMNAVFAGRLLVKVSGADANDGQPARLTSAQIQRFTARLKGATMVGGLPHGGWTVWEFSSNEDPNVVANALRSDPDVICVEPENRLYTISLPVPNDPDWAYFEKNQAYIFHGSAGYGGSDGSSGGFSGGNGGSGGSGGSGGGGNGSGSHGSGGSGGGGGNGSGGTGGGGSSGTGGSGGSGGSGNSNLRHPRANTTGTGFRRLWNLWDSKAVTSDAGGVISGGWAVYPGTWYTASNKPTDCPIIAFVDTGADMGHPDFINAGGTGTDTTQGGQLMKSLSTAFLNGKAVAAGDPSDDDGHGTAVLGVALAAGNNGGFNGDGMIGIGYNSRGMVLKVVDSKGNITDDNVAAAIMYAADHHADIINISLGTTNYSQVLQDAVTYAFQKGTLVVAGGNENVKGGGNIGPVYPAACSGALAVAANGPGQKSADADYAGSGYYVGMAAPGGDLAPFASGLSYIQFVYSTAPRYQTSLTSANLNPPATQNYSYLLNGTSMATAHVSGAAGLYYGQNSLHQLDGNANLKAFQALQMSADGTAKAAGGGWEATQGFGSLDVLQLLKLNSTYNPRKATVGDVTGMAYYSGKPMAGVTVTATQTGPPFAVYTTTTQLDGTYRFKPFPGGIYQITASRPGLFTKSKRVQVTNGCDMPGVDFFSEAATFDKTPPVIGHFAFLGQTLTTMTFDQWAFDPETEIDSATVQAGTTPGSSNLMLPQVIIPGNTRVLLTRLRMPAHYYVTFNYKNGVGETSQAVQSAQADMDDAYISDAHPTLDMVQPHLNVSKGATGSNQVAYLSIDISAIRSKVPSAKLTLTGSAPDGPVTVGVYGTNNAAWTESGLNWSNAPTLAASATSQVTVNGSGQYTWGIASLVEAAKKAGLTKLTIALVCETASKSGATFEGVRSATPPLLMTSSAD